MTRMLHLLQLPHNSWMFLDIFLEFLDIFCSIFVWFIFSVFFVFDFQFQKFLLTCPQRFFPGLVPVQYPNEPLRGVLNFCYVVPYLQHFFLILSQNLSLSPFLSPYITHLCLHVVCFPVRALSTVKIILNSQPDNPNIPAIGELLPMLALSLKLFFAF